MVMGLVILREEIGIVDMILWEDEEVVVVRVGVSGIGMIAKASVGWLREEAAEIRVRNETVWDA